MKVVCAYWAGKPTGLPEWFRTDQPIEITSDMLVELYRTGVNVMLRHSTPVPITDYLIRAAAFDPGSSFTNLLVDGLAIAQADVDCPACLSLFLGKKYDVSLNTLKCWMKGKDTPKSEIQRWVISYLLEKVKQMTDTIIYVDDRCFTQR